MKKFCFLFLVSISFLFLSCQSTKIDLPKNDDEISIFQYCFSGDKFVDIQQIFLTDEKNGSYRAEFSQTHSFINKKNLSVKKICKNIQQNKIKPISINEFRFDYSKHKPPAYAKKNILKKFIPKMIFLQEKTIIFSMNMVPILYLYKKLINIIMTMYGLMIYVSFSQTMMKMI